MPRNLDYRVEVAFPVLDPKLQAQLQHILDIQLADSTKAREVLADGRSRYLRREAAVPIRSQERLYEFTRSGEMLPDIPGSENHTQTQQAERM